MKKFKKIWTSLGKAASQTIKHDGIEHAGYMSFMVLLCLFPFIVFFLAVASFIGASDLGKGLLYIIIDSLPDSTTELLKSSLHELLNAPPPSLLTLAVLGSIWTASSFVEGLRTILNKIYMVEAPPHYILRRILSIAQFFILICILFLVTIVLVLIPITIQQMPELQKLIELYIPLGSSYRYTLLFSALFFTVSMIYYAIPNKKISFVEIIPGAALTVILWGISANLLSKYIQYYTQLSIIYGSLGNIIITLLFFYIINTIFIYGAEFNYLYHKKSKE